MLERWLLFLGVVLAAIGAAFLGDRLGRGEPPPAPATRRATVAVAVGLLVLLVRGWLRFHPAAEAWVLSADWSPILRPWWAIPAAFLVLGVGARRMSTETHAVVLDPLAGRQTLPRAELEALWRGVLVVVRRPA